MEFTLPKTKDPIGTEDELLLMGLSPLRYACCAVARQHELLGCPFADPRAKPHCEFGARHPLGAKYNFRERPAEEGGGPRNVIVLIGSHDGSGNCVALPCFTYMSRVADHRLQETVFEVIGLEGEAFETKESVEVKNTVETPMGPKTGTIIESITPTRTCPAFPRPKDNELLRGEVGSKRIFEAAASRDAERRRGRAGLSDPTATPAEVTMAPSTDSFGARAQQLAQERAAAAAQTPAPAIGAADPAATTAVLEGQGAEPAANAPGGPPAAGTDSAATPANPTGSQRGRNR